jgi:hypothetical protein
MEVVREEIPVLFVACADEVAEIRTSWERLGGRYLRERLRGEPPEVYDRIPGAAQALGPRDPSRPILEHYRRRDEIDVLLPVR